MPNLTVSLPQELHRFIKDHKEIKWSQIVRNAIHDYTDKIKLMEKIIKKTKAKREIDVDEMISKAVKKIYSEK